jgi:hypothetical protein
MISTTPEAAVMPGIRLDLTGEQADIIGFSLTTALREQRKALATWRTTLALVEGKPEPETNARQAIDGVLARIARIEEARELLDEAPALAGMLDMRAPPPAESAMQPW